MNIYELLESACEAVRGSEKDVYAAERMADRVLELCYGAGELEISADCTELKRTALQLKHQIQKSIHEKDSVIVCDVQSVITQLRAFIQTCAPEYVSFLSHCAHY